MSLYYVDRCYENILDIFKPQIPTALMQGENKTIPRICLSKSIEGCINAASWGHSQIAYRTENEVFRLYVFDEKDILKENFIDSNKLWEDDLVPDAYLTQEIWVVNQNLKPKSISYFSIGEYWEDYREPILNPKEYKQYLLDDTIPDNAYIWEIVKELDIKFIDNKNLKLTKSLTLSKKYGNISNLLSIYLPKEVDINVFENDDNYIYNFNDIISINYSLLLSELDTI